ncbi:MAG: phenylacetate-CoA oxygenase subunit PaaC [Euzebyales bacterium]|jgi:ring-1,2-phenylacetyl-CoA epoxidase subunit PaaC|nr:phenylacetate-CoA oxygenase subunit PaaC [Euzebyales bacterium]
MTDVQTVAGTSLDQAKLALLLALADDELVIGHRHSHWTGVAPQIEEDLAFSSIAQDEIGHAVVWYTIAADTASGSGRAEGASLDALGLGRPMEGYRNAILVERENRDWAFTIARQYLYDTADDVRLEALAGSSWLAVADATGALRREERYHLLHAHAWVDRLADGPVEARRKLGDGLVAAFGEALGLFEPLPGEEELVAEGILPAPHAELLQRWLDLVAADLSRVGLERVLEEGAVAGEGEMVATSSGEMAPAEVILAGPHVTRRGDQWVPVGEFRGRGGRHGIHSEDFPAVWEEMTGTYRAHPGARW